MNRYARQLALPEIDLIAQEKLNQTSILMVGAGGLGAAALPYLAGAGIGHIIIADHDTIDITNLHRQTTYKTAQQGLNKAQTLADYLRALNTEIKITTITQKISAPPMASFNLILDGSDNFETKAILNDIALSTHTPLITASVNQWQGQIGIFEGHEADKPCYRCLFPEFPKDARNCNEAGILGTTAGILGLFQAHIALLFLLKIEESTNNFISLDLKSIRISKLTVKKDPNCPYCHPEALALKDLDLSTTDLQSSAQDDRSYKNIILKEPPMIELITREDIDPNTCIIDVRQPEELAADPIDLSALHIPLPELIARLSELPEGKRLAFLCAGNIRSRQAAEYLAAKGYNNVCILDKFSL